MRLSERPGSLSESHRLLSSKTASVFLCVWAWSKKVDISFFASDPTWYSKLDRGSRATTGISRVLMSTVLASERSYANCI